MSQEPEVIVPDHMPPVGPGRAGRGAAGKLDTVAHHVRGILTALGLDLKDPNLAETDLRVAKMYLEMFRGLAEGAEPKVTTFPNEEGYSHMVMEKQIPFYSMCAHHLVPFYGHAHIAYIPRDRILGLSKFARILEFYAKRPQLQERLTEQVVDLPRGEAPAAGRHGGHRGAAPLRRDARRQEAGRGDRHLRPARHLPPEAGARGVPRPAPPHVGLAGASSSLLVAARSPGCGGGGATRSRPRRPDQPVPRARVLRLAGRAPSSRLATPEEIQAFLALQRRRSGRGVRRAASGQQRDPTPDAPGNPLREAFEERAAEADRALQRGRPPRPPHRPRRHLRPLRPRRRRSTTRCRPSPTSPPIEVWIYGTARALRARRQAPGARLPLHQERRPDRALRRPRGRPRAPAPTGAPD